MPARTGFQDADGNDLLITVGGFNRGGTGLQRPRAQWEANGFSNPLIPGLLGNWLRNLWTRFSVHSFFEGTVEEDATTARRDILLKGGFIPETRTPDSGSLQISSSRHQYPRLQLHHIHHPTPILFRRSPHRRHSG